MRACRVVACVALWLSTQVTAGGQQRPPIIDMHMHARLAIALMTQYPQVHADVSTITWILPRQAFHRYLRNLVEAGFGSRLMFGSDQMNWPETIDLAIEAIDSATYLTVEQKRDIFYNNAARFLRLTPR
jgi:predicted TIM-barrel fold metal-dependent hydrolase